MFRKILNAVLPIFIIIAASQASFGQNTTITKKEVVVNPDGTYTVIEYPVGKEVGVNLLPSSGIIGGKGTARVIRSADGTRIFFDVAGMPATTNSFYAYAVDPAGVPTLLGPITVTNGVGKGEFSTDLNQFMLVLSPLETLAAVNAPDIIFSSEVPLGYTVVPRISGPVSAARVEGASHFAYNVPLLNIPAFGEDEKELKLKFDGELSGLEAKVNVDREKGATKIRMTVENMKRVPANKRMILWAQSPEGKFTKLGQVINTGRRDDTTIQSETALTDFGLFLTVEDKDVLVPTSRLYSAFRVTG
ncbi:MAG: hypothetical protein ACRD6X_01685 [Pyrinomonadaceae bacterium]